MTGRAADGTGPFGHVGACPSERAQQLVQAVLRMRRIEHVPARLVHVAVETGQDHGALRQLGDRCEQLARRRLRAGRARRDHRRRGWVCAPACGLVANGQRASLDGVDPPTFGQKLRPGLTDDREKTQRALPMTREVAFDQPFELIERHAFDGEFVEQQAKLTRELQRLRRRLCDGMSLVVLEGCHELGEQRLALRRVDGRRQRQRVTITGGDFPFAVIDVAQRRHARQDRGRAVGGAQEGFTQGAHRAPRRQQDQHIRERKRIAAVLGQHHPRQLVGETAFGADGEEALHPSTRSASASAAGVPTWNQSPSCTTP